MTTDNKKLTLRRQSIRTLTDSELRIAHGGAPVGHGTNGAPAPGTDRQTISGGTSVIRASTSVVYRLTSTIIHPSGGRQNPSG